MIEDTQVAGDNLVLENSATGNIDSVAVVGDYNDSACKQNKIMINESQKEKQNC